MAASVQVFSDTELYLSPDAVLVPSPDSNDYDRARRHLLWVDNLRRFTLSGPGRIDGAGTAYLDTTGSPMANWTMPCSAHAEATSRRRVRENFISTNDGRSGSAPGTRRERSFRSAHGGRPAG